MENAKLSSSFANLQHFAKPKKPKILSQLPLLLDASFYTIYPSLTLVFKMLRQRKRGLSEEMSPRLWPIKEIIRNY